MCSVRLVLQELLKVLLIQLLLHSGTDAVGMKNTAGLTQEQETGEREAENLQKQS